MKRKMFGAVLAGVLSLSLLAGCGSSTSDNPAEAAKERFAQYVDLGEYKGIQYTPTETRISDEDVESQLQRWAMNYSKEVEDKTSKAEKGDKVNIDYVGTIDGVAFDGGDTKGTGTTITLGSSGYISGFDDQIVGHTPGETFDVVATFPEDYGKEELNGREAVFKTTLNYISKTEYPELTDELVKENTEYDTVEAYRKYIEEEMVKEQAATDKDTDIENMMDQIVETSAVKQYPEKELKQRIERLTTQIQNAASSYGMELNQYLMIYGFDADSFQEDIRTSTEAYLKRRMVVAAIAAKEDISVTKAEADAKIQELLKATGYSDVSQLNSVYGYSNDDYYIIVLEEKVLEFIYDNAVAKSADDTEASTGDTAASTEEAASTESAE